MPKLVISLAYFENTDDIKPQRVANIGFIEKEKPEADVMRLAVKESGEIVFDRDFYAGASLVPRIIQNGREILYVPDRLVGWLLGAIRQNASSVFSALADELLRPKGTRTEKGDQNVQ